MALVGSDNRKFLTLKAALRGVPDALRALINVFGAEKHFYGGGPYDPITENANWQDIDSVTFDLLGGTYWVDILTFFTGNVTNRDYQIRFLVNGTPLGDEVSRELKDPDDVIEYGTFNEYAGVMSGNTTITLQALLTPGPGNPTMTVTRFRTRVWMAE